jgi:hypothetical protein
MEKKNAAFLGANWRDIVTDGAALCGGLLIVVGVAYIFIPAAFIVGGVFCLIVALVASQQ